MTADLGTAVLDSQPQSAGDPCALRSGFLPVTAQVLSGLRCSFETCAVNGRICTDPGGAFSRYEWFEAYARTLVAAPERIAFVRCADARGVLAIIPAVPSVDSILPFGRLRALTLAAHAHLAVMDFPMAPRADPRTIGSAVIEVLDRIDLPWSVIRWKRSPFGGNAWRIATALGHWAFVRCASPANGFDTRLPFSTLQRDWSKNLRASLRKSHKRIGEAPTWTVTSSIHRSELAQFFEEFLRVEASGWKGPGGTNTAIALNERLRAFYAAVLRESAEGFVCEITLLQVAGRTISAHFAIVAERCKHIMKIAYDEAAGKFSPGQLLLEEVVKRACADASIDHVSLATDMQWHRTWRPIPVENCDVLIFRNAAAAIAYRCYLTMLPLLHALRDHIHPA